MTLNKYIEITPTLLDKYKSIAFTEPETQKYYNIPLTEDTLTFLQFIYGDRNIHHINRNEERLTKGKIEFYFD